MRALLPFTFCILIYQPNLFALFQSKPDSIFFYRSCFGHRKYLHQEKDLSTKKLFALLDTIPECQKLVKQANVFGNLGYTFSFAGGFIIGYQYVINVNQTDRNNDTDYYFPLYAGVILALFAIPISRESEKIIEKAIEIYNSKIGAK